MKRNKHLALVPRFVVCRLLLEYLNFIKLDDDDKTTREVKKSYEEGRTALFYNETCR